MPRGRRRGRPRAGQHDLAGQCGPVTGLQGDIIDRAARGGAAGQCQRRPGSARRSRVPGGLHAGASSVVTVASGNGPAAAVDLRQPPVAASSAAVALAGSMVAATSAPRCAANAWSNGALEATARARSGQASAGGYQQHQADHGHLHPPPAEAAPHGTGNRPRHCTAHLASRPRAWPPVSPAIRPSASHEPSGWRSAAASAGLWVTSTRVCPDAVQIQQQAADLLACRGVQCTGRLIGQQQRGPVHQRPRDRDPLPFPARQPRRVGVAVLLDPQRGQQLARPAAGPARRGSPRAARAAARCRRRSGRRAG